VCALVGFFVFDLILGTVAVILGLISLLQGSQTNRNSAIAGIIIGVIDVIYVLFLLK
jgi:hypothetical protein